MSREYVTQDNFKPTLGPMLDPDLSNEDVTERDGYRPTEKIVNDFIRAGERLAQFRRDEFDAEYDEEDIELPIERVNGFDAAEASMILESEAKRIASLPQKVPEVIQEPPKAEEAPNGGS